MSEQQAEKIEALSQENAELRRNKLALTQTVARLEKGLARALVAAEGAEERAYSKVPGIGTLEEIEAEWQRGVRVTAPGFAYALLLRYQEQVREALEPDAGLRAASDT